MVCIVVFCTIALGRPQTQGNIGLYPTPEQWLILQQQLQQWQPAVNTASTTVAPSPTPSPQYLACLGACPSTMEYNPICGDDELNYHNMGRLQCAQRCGRNVAAVRGGTCKPL